MMSLEEMIAMRSRTTKREAVTAFMNLMMKPGQAVKNHMMKVLGAMLISKSITIVIDNLFILIIIRSKDYEIKRIVRTSGYV